MSQKGNPGQQRENELSATQALVEKTHMLYIGLREAGMTGEQAHKLVSVWFVDQLKNTDATKLEAT